MKKSGKKFLKRLRGLLIKMEREEALKECFLYRVCRDSSKNLSDEPKCKSGNIEQYTKCERYDPTMIPILVPISKLKELGYKFFSYEFING